MLKKLFVVEDYSSWCDVKTCCLEERSCKALGVVIFHLQVLSRQYAGAFLLNCTCVLGSPPLMLLWGQ